MGDASCIAALVPQSLDYVHAVTLNVLLKSTFTSAASLSGLSFLNPLLHDIESSIDNHIMHHPSKTVPDHPICFCTRYGLDVSSEHKLARLMQRYVGSSMGGLQTC